MAEETKSIHISDILSITTGRLVSNDHIQGVYNILDWMVDDNLFTHQLGRAAESCAPFLKEIFPRLAEIEYPTDLPATKEAINGWIDKQEIIFGSWFEVPRLPEGIYEPMDALEEIFNHMPEANLTGESRVIAIVKDE